MASKRNSFVLISESANVKIEMQVVVVPVVSLLSEYTYLVVSLNFF